MDDWNTDGNAGMIIEIDGKRYRTGYENVVLMEAQPDTEKEREIHPC